MTKTLVKSNKYLLRGEELINRIKIKVKKLTHTNNNVHGNWLQHIAHLHVTAKVWFYVINFPIKCFSCMRSLRSPQPCFGLYT